MNGLEDRSVQPATGSDKSNPFLFKSNKFLKADTYFAARFSDVHVEFVAKSTSDAVEIIIFEVVQLK